MSGGHVILTHPNPGVVFAVNAAARVRCEVGLIDVPPEVAGSMVFVINAPAVASTPHVAYLGVSESGDFVGVGTHTMRFVLASLTTAAASVNLKSDSGSGSVAVVGSIHVETDSEFVGANGAKRGLGSSAAVSAAVSDAVMRSLVEITQRPPHTSMYSSKSWHDAVFATAYVAHCSVQGGLGSGFDVAAGAFGSCVYIRPPSVAAAGDGVQGYGDAVNGVAYSEGGHTTVARLAALRAALAAAAAADPAARATAAHTACVAAVGSAATADNAAAPAAVAVTRAAADALAAVVACGLASTTADAPCALLRNGHTAVAMPAALCEAVRVIMLDIGSGGEGTPGLAKRVRAYVDANPEAAEWTALVASGKTVASAAEAAAVGYASASRDAATAALSAFGAALRAHRRAFAAVGVAGGIPLEPPAYGPVLDAAEALPGVLAAVCPGAGGEDGAAVVVAAADVEAVATALRAMRGVGGIEVMSFVAA